MGWFKCSSNVQVFVGMFRYNSSVNIDQIERGLTERVREIVNRVERKIRTESAPFLACGFTYDELDIVRDSDDPLDFHVLPSIMLE